MEKENRKKEEKQMKPGLKRKRTPIKGVPRSLQLD